MDGGKNSNRLWGYLFKREHMVDVSNTPFSYGLSLSKLRSSSTEGAITCPTKLILPSLGLV